MAGRGQEIGLAVIGCGPIGRIRAELARDYPGIGWLGVCDIREDLAKELGRDAGADFVTTDAAELLARDEVNVIACSSRSRWPWMCVIPSRSRRLSRVPELMPSWGTHNGFDVGF